jgi:hypothetical protein
MAERDITLRVAIRNAEEAIRALKKLGTDGEEALERLGVGSKKASAGLKEVTTESTKAARQSAQQFSNAGAQIQDIVVQISSGTSVMQAAAQQVPQLLSAFNFGPLGIAAGIAAAAVGGLAASMGLFGNASEAAAKKTAEQEDALRGLFDAFKVSTGSADEFTASLQRLSREQELLTGSRLTDTLKQQRDELESLRDQMRDTASFAAADIPNVRFASAGTLQKAAREFGSGIDSPALGSQEEALERFRDALRTVQEEIRLFMTGDSSPAEFRAAMQGLADVPGIETLASELSEAFAQPAEKAEILAKQIELVEARQTLLVDPTNAAALAVVNQAKAMADATSAAEAYGKAMAETLARSQALTAEDRYVEQHIGKFQIDKLPPEERQEARVGAEAALRAESRDKEAQELSNKTIAIQHRLAAAEKELTFSINERTRAGEQAAASMRAQEGATEQQVQDAKRIALAKYDQAKAIQEANKAATTAGRQTEFLERKKEEAEATRREAEAIRGTAQETEHALRYLKEENEFRRAGLNVQDASIKKRIDESVAAKELEASLKAELNAREDVTAATKLQERLAAGLGQRPITDDVTKAALEGAYNDARARGDQAISFEGLQERVKALSQIEEKLKNITNPTKRAEILRQNIALYEQGKASDAAAKGLDAIADTRRSVDQEKKLSEALKEGLEIYKQRRIEIEVENELREQGVGLAEKDREELKKLKIEARTRNEANDRAVKSMEDAAKRSAEAFRDVFEQPFKDLTSTISNVASNTVLDFTRSGELSGKAFAERFTEGIQNIGANLAGTLLSAPINAAVSTLSAQLQQAALPVSQGGTGGGLMGQVGALGKWTTASPLNAGLAGAAAGGMIGSVGGALMGRPNSYAGTGGALGGAAGAAIGTAIFPGIGTAIGGLLGSVGGGLFGGMFGGGDDNSGDNNFGRYWNAKKGVTYSETPQDPQNISKVDAIIAELQKASKVITLVGGQLSADFGLRIKSGNNSGISVAGKSYSSIEDAIAAAIGMLADQGTRFPGGGTTATILENTKAASAQQLQADLEFGKEFDRLTRGGGDLGRSIQAITDQFAALQMRAEELGLSTRKLEAVQDEQIHQLKEEARHRIDVLTGNAGEYRQALVALSATYEEAKKAAIDLGMSTKDLNYARDQERAKIREDAEYRVGALTGQLGEYQQALKSLNDTYEEAKKLAIDLGMSTKDLNYARDQARGKLLEDAEYRIGGLTGELGPYQQELLKLNRTYEEAKKLAIDLGKSTNDLNDARNRERALLRANSERIVKRATGDFGSFDEAMLELNARFDEARKHAIDLGLSIERLNEARDEERALLSTRFSTDLRVMMGEIDPLASEILNLRDAFRAANENARDLGISEIDLAAARRRAEADMVEQRREQSREALLGQADNIRNFFRGILEPLRQSTSAFGGLQGIAAPQASINSGLREYRSTLARALNRDDVGAAQALPGVSQQLIQLARQYGASGPEFRKILEEVTRGNEQVTQRYRDREFEVMKSIPAEVARTGAETVRTLVDGFKRLLEANERLERAIKATKAGSPLSQAA